MNQQKHWVVGTLQIAVDLKLRSNCYLCHTLHYVSGDQVWRNRSDINPSMSYLKNDISVVGYFEHLTTTYNAVYGLL